MLKVECESCRAPYQVDERRVPPGGLKMRCPKCGHTFLVTDPNAKPAPPAAGSAPGGGQTAPRPPAAPARGPKATMMGVPPAAGGLPGMPGMPGAPRVGQPASDDPFAGLPVARPTPPKIQPRQAHAPTAPTVPQAPAAMAKATGTPLEFGIVDDLPAVPTDLPA